LGPLFFSAALFVVYPPSIWHAINTIWDTTLFTLLAVYLLALLSEYTGDFRLRGTVKFGLVMGISALVNAVILTFYPFAVLWLLVQNRETFLIRLKFCFLLTGVVCLLLTPWVARNYQIFKRPLLRSNLGVELWLGNNEQNFDTYFNGLGKNPIVRHPSIDKDEFVKFVDLGELAYADSKFIQATNFISESPDKFLFLTKKRIMQFWLDDYSQPNDWTGDLNITFSVSGIKKACHILPIPFFLVGLFASMSNRKNALFFAYLFFIPLIYYVTHVTERYRFPVEPMIIIFACYGGIVLFGIFSRANARWQTVGR